MNQISVRFQSSGLSSSRAILKNFTSKVLSYLAEAEGYPAVGIDVLFCSEKEIQRLNRDFRAMDKATDVLSFPSGEELDDLATAGGHLGDLALCLPYCARQAPDFKRTPGEEVALLLVHGFLHLTGWDHETKAQEKKMWARTDVLLKDLPVPIPSIDVKGL